MQNFFLWRFQTGQACIELLFKHLAAPFTAIFISGALRTHLGSDHLDHIQRCSEPHVNAFLVK